MHLSRTLVLLMQKGHRSEQNASCNTGIGSYQSSISITLSLITDSTTAAKQASSSTFDETLSSTASSE